jgi:hypothetical protein
MCLPETSRAMSGKFCDKINIASEQQNHRIIINSDELPNGGKD